MRTISLRGHSQQGPQVTLSYRSPMSPFATRPKAVRLAPFPTGPVSAPPPSGGGDNGWPTALARTPVPPRAGERSSACRHSYYPANGRPSGSASAPSPSRNGDIGGCLRTVHRHVTAITVATRCRPPSPNGAIGHAGRLWAVPTTVTKRCYRRAHPTAGKRRRKVVPCSGSDSTSRWPP